MSSSYYPYLPTAPIRTFVTADSGFAINSEYSGAVTAGQTITGTLRTLSNQKNGVMVAITGILDPHDVELVYISVPYGSFGDSIAFSLVPASANGVTAWFASPLVRTWAGSTSYTVVVKFRNARGAVVVRSQEYPL